MRGGGQEDTGRMVFYPLLAALVASVVSGGSVASVVSVASAAVIVVLAVDCWRDRWPLAAEEIGQEMKEQAEKRKQKQ